MGHRFILRSQKLTNDLQNAIQVLKPYTLDFVIQLKKGKLTKDMYLCEWEVLTCQCFPNLNWNTSKKKDPQKHCIGFRFILPMTIFVQLIVPKPDNIRLVRGLKIFLKGSFS